MGLGDTMRATLSFLKRMTLVWTVLMFRTNPLSPRAGLNSQSDVRATDTACLCAINCAYANHWHYKVHTLKELGFLLYYTLNKCI